MIFNYYNNEDEKGSILNPKHVHMDTVPPADLRCMRVIEFARICLQREADEQRRVMLVRDHIAGLREDGLRLQPSQINSIRARASWEPGPMQALQHKEAEARLLVQTAAKSLLIDVPLRTFDDFRELLGIIATPGGTLSSSQKIAVEKHLRHFLAAVVHGRNIDATCFTSGDDLLSVEKLRGPVQVGQEYLYRYSRSHGSSWQRVTILRKHRGGLLATFHDRGDAELVIGRNDKTIRPLYRVVASFGRPPAPRYFTSAEGDHHNGSRILSTHATDRVASRGWYVLATGEGKKERRRLVTLEGADDRWLYLGASFDNKRIPRGKWRLYRVDRWVMEGDTTAEMKASAAAAPIPSRWQEPDKSKPATPKAAVIAALAGRPDASAAVH